jgi:protein subunit release factor B
MPNKFYFQVLVMKEKQLVLSVTAADCVWSYTRGSGKGGQKKNKTSSAVHCKHPPSSAHGYAEDHRSQLENRKLAFLRMIETPEFVKWRKMEFLRRTGQQAVMEDTVNREMNNIRVENKDENGLWKEVNKHDPLSGVES